MPFWYRIVLPKFEQNSFILRLHWDPTTGGPGVRGAVVFNPARLMTWPASYSRESTVLITSAMVAFVGLLDYLISWQISLSVIYVYPIAIAAWYVGARFACL